LPLDELELELVFDAVDETFVRRSEEVEGDVDDKEARMAAAAAGPVASEPRVRVGGERIALPAPPLPVDI
jgi:hypothetical protein